VRLRAQTATRGATAGGGRKAGGKPAAGGATTAGDRAAGGQIATVGAGGRVVPPAPVRGRVFRLQIVRAAFPAGTSGRDRQARAVGIAELRGEGVPRARVPRSGPLRGGCGDLAGSVGGRRLRLRVEGDVADLDAGRPLRVRGCGTVSLPAGATRLSLPSGALAPYLIRLRSPAPRPRARAAAAPGRVVSAGRAGRGERRDIRLDLRAPAWLVFGEAYNRGWRATCDGRAIVPPSPVDGYAMGWRVPASCRDVDIAFAPNRLVRAGQVASAAAIALLALVLLRRRRPSPAPRQQLTVPADAPRRLPARRAALAAVVLSPAFGFVFAARATPLFAIGLFVILWRGISASALLAVAGALLVVAAPVLTLLIPVTDRGGYDPDYAGERIAVHWVTAAAVALLIVALARLLATARRRGARSPA
jgi:hypothetical protein